MLENQGLGILVIRVVIADTGVRVWYGETYLWYNYTIISVYFVITGDQKENSGAVYSGHRNPTKDGWL